jgi:hypothetical protein
VNFDLTQNIETHAPKAWEDFKKYYSVLISPFPDSITLTDFNLLPFQMQFGVFLEYFIDNGLNLDLCNYDTDTIQEMIYETFVAYEKMMGHYS